MGGGFHLGRSQVSTPSTFEINRERMVEEQLIPRGIIDPRVLVAMRLVPRHLFVEDAMQANAYGDYPLPIGSGQTISQPYIVALMTQTLQLKGTEKVLEIGTGSGYQAAILSRLCGRVYTIERINALVSGRARYLTGSAIITSFPGSMTEQEGGPRRPLLTALW